VARVSSKEMADIVARDMPGFRIAEPAEAPLADAADAAPRGLPEASTPDIADLRRKYFGDETGAAGPAAMGDAGADAAPADDNDEEIVHVVPKDNSDPWDRARRPKAVVFSHSEKRVVGYQG
jgi:hypothetical protein